MTPEPFDSETIPWERHFLLLRRYGGCGILPSGTYHLGLPTTLEDRRWNAATLFADLVRESEQPELNS